MLSGLAFAVLFVAGMILGRDTPESDVDDREWTEWFSDSDNRVMQVVSMILITLAAVALVVFVTGLVERLRNPRPRSDMPAQVAYGAGMILATALAFGGVALNQMSAAIEIGDIPIPSPDVLRTAEQLGFGLILMVGGLFAALTVAAVSVAARGTGVLPSWLVTAGFVVAFILLFSLAFIPMILLPLWVIAVSIASNRNPA
jgi:hypothetical protein